MLAAEAQRGAVDELVEVEAVEAVEGKVEAVAVDFERREVVGADHCLFGSGIGANCWKFEPEIISCFIFPGIIQFPNINVANSTNIFMIQVSIVLYILSGCWNGITL